MGADRTVVISGAPGTGKTTIGRHLSESLGFPFLSLDVIKETLADSLGPGGEDWSDLLGDTAAEVLFKLTPTFPEVVVEGWWRGERRQRALREFEGCIEVFCRCEPALADARMRARHNGERHSIHRDVINPELLERSAYLVETVVPLGLGSALIEVDTSVNVDRVRLLSDVRSSLETVE